MCGLIGYSGKENFNLNNIKILFLYNYARGSDSSGYFTPLAGVFKKKGKLIENLHEFKIVEDKYLLGHTRQGTVGSNTDENAHPFEEGNTICVHNGFIKEWKEKTEGLGVLINGINVDSHAFTKLIETIGLKETVENLPGSHIATITYNKEEDCLYVYRNKERPLFRGRLPEGLYISSTEESLKAIGCERIKSFSEDYIYKIKDGVVDVPIKVSITKEPAKKVTGKILHYVQYCNEYSTMIGMTKDKWYRVIDKTANDMYTILNDLDKEVTISNYTLKHGDSFTPGQDIIAMRELAVVNKKLGTVKHLGKPGDTLKFLKYDFDFETKEYRVEWKHPNGGEFVSDCGAFRHPEKYYKVIVNNVVKREGYPNEVYVVDKIDNSGSHNTKVVKIVNGRKNTKNEWCWEQQKSLTKIADDYDLYIASVNKVKEVKPLSDDKTGIDSLDAKIQDIYDDLLHVTMIVDDVYYTSNDFPADKYREFYQVIDSTIQDIEELKDEIKKEAVKEPF
jgi:hypothetical protein